MDLADQHRAARPPDPVNDRSLQLAETPDTASRHHRHRISPVRFT
jgi:hypothetical protein